MQCTFSRLMVRGPLPPPWGGSRSLGGRSWETASHLWQAAAIWTHGGALVQSESSKGKIVLAQVRPPEQDELYVSASEKLLQVLVPGASTERFGRTWRIGRISHPRTDAIFGRIGFSRESGAESWDEAVMDFVDVLVPSGLAAPFTIDLTSLRVAFQIRPPDIKATSFTGALQAILREKTDNDGWAVEVLRQEATFEHWLSSMRAITELRLKLTPPNPNYRGRPAIQDLIERMNADAATIILTSQDGLAIQSDDGAGIISQAIAHVDLHYGSLTATGIDARSGRKSTFDSTHGEAHQTLEGTVDPTTGEVSEGALLDRMSDLKRDL